MVDKYDKGPSTSLHSRMDSSEDSSSFNDDTVDSVDLQFDELVRKKGLHLPSRRKNVFEHSPKNIQIRRSVVERALLSKKIPSSTPMPHNRKLNFTPDDAAACSPIDLQENTKASSVSERSQCETSESNSKSVTSDQSKSKNRLALEDVIEKLIEKKQNSRTIMNRTVQTSNNKLLDSVRQLARRPIAQERQTQTGDSLRRLITKTTSVKDLPKYDELVSKSVDPHNNTATADCSSFLRTGGSVMERVEAALQQQHSPKKGKSDDESLKNNQAPWRVPSGFNIFVGNDPQDENLEESVDSLDETFRPKIKPKKKDYVKKKILVGSKKRDSLLAKKKPKKQGSSIPQIDDREEPLQDLTTNRRAQRPTTSSTKDTSIQCLRTPEETEASSRTQKFSTSLKEARTNRKAQRPTTTSTKDTSIQCSKTPEETETSNVKEKVSRRLKEAPLQDSVTNRKPQRPTTTSTKDTSVQCLKTPEETEASNRKERVSTSLKEAHTNRKAQRPTTSSTKDTSIQCLKTPEETETSNRREKVSRSLKEAPHQDSVTNKKSQRPATTSTKDVSIQCFKTPQETKTSNRKEKVSTNLREEELLLDLSRNRKQQKIQTISTEDSIKKKREGHGTSIPRIDDREDLFQDLLNRTKEIQTTSTKDTSVQRLRSLEKSKTSERREKVRENNLLESAEKAGPSNILQRLTFTNDEVFEAVAGPSACEPVHATTNSSKLRKRLFNSTDSETVVSVKKRSKSNRTEEEDNPGQSTAKEEPVNSQVEEAPEKTVTKGSKGKNKKSKETVSKRKTESTKKTTLNATESISTEVVPDGLRRSTRERKRPPPRGENVMMIGSQRQFNLLMGVNMSHVDVSIGRNSNIRNSVKNSTKRTKSSSSRVTGLSTISPIAEQDEDPVDTVAGSDTSHLRSVKTGRVSKKKDGQNKAKKVSTSSKSKSENHNKSRKNSYVGTPPKYTIIPKFPGLSIAVTLNDTYHSSHGYMKLGPRMPKPFEATNKSPMDYLVVEGVAEVELDNEIFRVKKSNSFTVPKDLTYSIKNPNRQQLVLFYTRGKANVNTTT